MKMRFYLMACLCLAMASCHQKTKNDEAENNTSRNSTEQAIICKEIEKYLLDEPNNVMVETPFLNSLVETEWPEAQCPLSMFGSCPYDENCGPLFGVTEGTDFKVEVNDKNEYFYSVVCPCGCGERFVDTARMVASLDDDNVVHLERFSY